MRWIVFSICLVLLPATGAANPAHQQLMSFSEAKRNYVLTHFLRQGGERCSTVTESFYQGSYNGAAFWSVRCRSAEAYQITILNDAGGSTRIADCGTLKLVGVECFKKFAPAPKTPAPKKQGKRDAP